MTNLNIMIRVLGFHVFSTLFFVFDKAFRWKVFSRMLNLFLFVLQYFVKSCFWKLNIWNEWNQKTRLVIFNTKFQQNRQDKNLKCSCDVSITFNMCQKCLTPSLSWSLCNNTSLYSRSTLGPFFSKGNVKFFRHLFCAK